MSAKYALLPPRESQDESISDVEKSSHRSRYRFSLDKMNSRPRLWLNLWAMSNTVFSIFLVIAAFSLSNDAKSLIDRPLPPSSPLREDGAERFVNTRYQPNKIFQSPPSDEVDAAWNDWLRDHDHMIRVSGEKVKEFGLPESVELYKNPGSYAYGLGVYHQMHCLSRLRKSFYPDRYYPNVSQHKIQHHINHCLDVLRQAILCHGDVSMVYWWNQNYTYIDDTGTRQYTDEYMQRTPEERATGSFVTWDSVVQCRDIDAINAWAARNAVDDDDYGGQVVD